MFRLSRHRSHRCGPVLPQAEADAHELRATLLEQKVALLTEERRELHALLAAADGTAGEVGASDEVCQAFS